MAYQPPREIWHHYGTIQPAVSRKVHPLCTHRIYDCDCATMGNQIFCFCFFDRQADLVRHRVSPPHMEGSRDARLRLTHRQKYAYTITGTHVHCL